MSVTRERRITVVSADGYQDLPFKIESGMEYADVARKYSEERGVPVSEMTIEVDDEEIDLNDTVRDNEKVLITIQGVHGVRAIFELYDGGARLPDNARPEAGNNVKNILFGRNIIMEPWNNSPYPRMLRQLLDQEGGILYVCDICLRYSPVKEWMELHIQKDGSCAQGNHPPGNKVMETADQKIAIWEVDGGISYDTITSCKGLPASELQNLTKIRTYLGRETFCQNLGLLSRFFLKGKTAIYGPGSFMYYTLTEYENNAWRVRGYFSIEKGTRSNSLACIMVLPPWQDRGFGRLLIHFSYIMGRPPESAPVVEKTPERPLSDLGMQVFLSYWKGAVIDAMHDMLDDNSLTHNTTKDIERLCRITVISKKDILKVLHTSNLMVKPGSATSELRWSELPDRVQRSEVSVFKGSSVFGKRYKPKN